MLWLPDRPWDSEIQTVLVEFDEGGWLDWYIESWESIRGAGLLLDLGGKSKRYDYFLKTMADAGNVRFLVQHTLGEEGMILVLGYAYRDKIDRLDRECDWEN